MDGIERFFGLTSFFGLGLIVGLSLLLALAVLLQAGERKKLVAPAVLLVVHVTVEAIVAFIPPTAVVMKPLRVVEVLLLLVALARGTFVLVADALLAGRLKRPLPRIFRDLLQTAMYFAAGFATLRVAGVELSSLLTTSALLTAVVGLSLQDTLGNLFAGISIQMQRPFEVGDFIQFDPDPRLIGRVIEINWRATTVLTNDEMEVIVPNGTLAKAPIRNYTKPSPIARRSVEVSCAYAVAPETVRATILSAMHEIPDVLATPEPSVLAWRFGDSGIDYVVRYFTSAFAVRDVTDSAVRERIWYALRRAGIEIPFPKRDVFVHQPSAERETQQRDERVSDVARRLREVDFLAVLPEATLRTLAERSPVKVYAPREVVLRQGEPGEAMFLIARGEVSVLVGRDGASTAEVARLKRGSLFGEMSLMTGEPRAASVQTLTETELVVVDKAAFAAVLADAPEVLTQMTRVLVARQAELESHLAARAAKSRDVELDERTSALLGRVRAFFKMT